MLDCFGKDFALSSEENGSFCTISVNYFGMWSIRNLKLVRFMENRQKATAVGIIYTHYFFRKN